MVEHLTPGRLASIITFLYTNTWPTVKVRRLVIGTVFPGVMAKQVRAQNQKG
jgi:hypothetical protein